MNSITLIGYLTADPEIKTTSNQTSVCTFTIASDRQFDKEHTDFFRINAWGKLGENCKRYLTKGKQVFVMGEQQARTYQTKDGKTLMSLDVQADKVKFLSSPEKKPKPKEEGFTDLISDDLPF